MKTSEKSETLSQAILREAHAEAEQILSAAQAKADAVRKQAEERAAAERRVILERGAQEIARLRSQAVSTAQLKARTSELEHREKVLNEVFQAARKQLHAVQDSPDYPQVARRLLEDALVSLRSSAVKVYADPVTARVLTGEMLADLCQEHKVDIQVGDPVSQNTGMVVESMDGHLNFDNTLETRLDRMQSNLRFSVFQLLVGETQ